MVSRLVEPHARTSSRALSWDDARRAVFQTAIVMLEIDRSLVGRRES
jgi:hypothetical protein